MYTLVIWAVLAANNHTVYHGWKPIQSGITSLHRCQENARQLADKDGNVPMFRCLKN